MNALSIGRWQTHYRARAPIDAVQRAAWDGCLDQIDVPDTDDMVFIRRLHLSTRLPHDGSAAHAAALWRDALLAALARETAAGEGANVVRFCSRRDALCDMLYRACCRDASRNWVWVRMALLAPGEQAPGAVLLRAIHALLQSPEAIWPALARLVLAEARTGAITAVLHRVPAPAMAALLLACPQCAPYQRASAETPSSSQLFIDITLPLVAALLAWCASHPALAIARREVVLVLLAAAACPAPAGGAAAVQPPIAASVLAACARLVGGVLVQHALPATARSMVVRTRPQDVDVKPATAHADTAASTPADRLPGEANQPAPALDDAIERVPTDWAGLPFLLHLLPAAGLVEQVAAIAPAPPDYLFRVLWHLATSILGMPALDAAVRAFCGGWQPDAGSLDEQGALRMPGPFALPGELVAHQLRAGLAQRLPDVSLRDLCARPGIIHFEPGWIDVHMPLRCADARVRRAGLDLDPGWLPWLGCVVRFVYE